MNSRATNITIASEIRRRLLIARGRNVRIFRFGFFCPNKRFVPSGFRATRRSFAVAPWATFAPSNVTAELPVRLQKGDSRPSKTLDGEGGQGSASRWHFLTTLPLHPKNVGRQRPFLRFSTGGRTVNETPDFQGAIWNF